MKKTLILSAMGLAAIGVLAWSFNYLSTGSIIITTNNKDSTVTLQRTGQGKPFSKVGLGSLSAIVIHGQYIATVKQGSQISARIISFNQGHKTFRYSISPASLLTVEPVAYQNTHDVAASGSGLVYLDDGDENLYEIDSQNNISSLGSVQQFQSVKWANTSFGVGQDNNGRLYTINNGSVSPLNVPFAYGGEAVNFDVAQNKQIYASYGADVYSGNQSGNFKKIYTAPSPDLVLAAGTDKVAVADGGESDDGGAQPLLAIVGESGSIIKKGGEGEIRSLVLSPGGQYLVSLNESYAGIYDSSLRQIATVPASSSVSYARWLDNNKFLYASGDQLWSYDLTSQRADLLAILPFSNPITGLALSSDRSYAYVTTVDAASNYIVSRIGLRGQQVPAYMSKLQSILPLTLNDCSLSLVNFTAPATILVESFPNSGLDSQAYLQEAQSELKQDGFDISQLRFNLVQGH